ncbi:tryptophan--tRNA ligase [Candidatus Kaiserbacteria bacterium]|nr:MAG: tryptophan--tRNA ligase [Candidatus Kaiserbacteria bacterium]
MTDKQRLLTGLQPSGTLHIGNYFGALKPFVDMYENYDSHLMVVDYHALTTMRDPEDLRANIINIVKDYVAAGVDPEKVILFRQSDVQEHTELSWIFQCLVSVPFLMQAHSYKDKVAKGLEANAGLFSYPMLMAADILLYDTEVVPVGEDQRQHIEYAREAANKFNNAYGETFIAPKENIIEGVGTVPGVDGKKMSKSYNNTIPLFGSKEEIESAVMSIVTDSDGEVPENVYAIHKLLRSEEDLKAIYEENKGQYGELKKILIEDLENLIAPMRERRSQITDEDVKKILENGAQKARERAQAKMIDVKKKIGVTL